MSDPTAFDIGEVGLWTDPLTARIYGETSHGRHHINMPYMTEVVPGLWHGGVTSGLILPEFITNVLSLYKWEEYTINHKMGRMLTVEMYDSVDQDTSQVEELAVWVNEARKLGPTLAHCQAGLNRSSLVVAKALLLSGEVANGPEAVELIRSKRSAACLCNPAFEQWVMGQ